MAGRFDASAQRVELGKHARERLSGMDQAARAGLLPVGTIAARLGPAVVNISRTTRTDTGSHIVPVWVRRS